MLSRNLIAAAGNAGGDNLYVEDVFSTYLYTGGLSSPNVIQTGIDLAAEGGLVWTKNRTSATSNQLTDTVSGYRIESDDTAAGEASQSNVLFNSDGHSLSGYSSFFNGGGDDYVSWTFRKAEKFFDVVTFTAASSGISTVSHNLGSVPACIIVKMTNRTGGWVVYHSGTDATSPQDKLLRLDLTDAVQTNSGYFGSTGPTDSEFQVTIFNNEPCVAYLFASDAGGFGDDGSENIIKCGVLTSTSSGFVDANCGFEPQWLLIKGTMINNWQLFDNMRGVTTGNGHERLFANTNGEESSSTTDNINFTATGFKANTFAGGFNGAGDYIYIAIRRPMKTPESGTEVFSAVARTATGATYTYSGNDFPVDMVMQRQRSVSNTVDQANIFDRLRGKTKSLSTAQTQAEETNSGITGFDYQDGYVASFGLWSGMNWVNGSTEVYWNFKRATGFFDVVAYTGTGSAHAEDHNLGVAPEMIIVKNRSGINNWIVYHSAVGSTKYLILNQNTGTYTASVFNNTDPTASEFSVGVPYTVNQASQTYIAYLFATVAGVSKVGSYTGTAATLNVDCGFSAGARFILIKRTDATGGWYVWDSARGIVAGNDPYLFLNTTASETTNTDYIDPLSSGFTVTSSAPAALNASGGNYIFLAIA